MWYSRANKHQGSHNRLMVSLFPSKSYLINLFISMWMWARGGGRPLHKEPLDFSGQVAEPTSEGCRSPREPAHNGTKDDYANARPFPETFPGRGAESEGDWRSTREGGRAAVRTSGWLCLSWRERWKRLCIPALLPKMHFWTNGCGWFIVISPRLAERGDKATSDGPDECRWQL